MKKVHHLLVVICLVGATSAGQTTTQPNPQTSPGTTTGQRIGNVISAAVSTAFPAVSRILDAIWPNRNQNPNDKKTATQAQTVLQTQKNTADAQQRQNVQDLTSAANDLSVARSFVTASAEIVARTSAMQALLASRPVGAPASLNDSEKARLQDLWGPAKTRLDTLQTDAVAKDIDTLSDNFLKSTFTEVRNAITDFGTNINNQLSQGRAEDLRNSLAQIQPKIVNIAPLTAILIGDLSSSLKKAAHDIAGGAGGVSDASAAADRQANLDLIRAINGFNQTH